jgi:hypothetical protein
MRETTKLPEITVFQCEIFLLKTGHSFKQLKQLHNLRIRYQLVITVMDTTNKYQVYIIKI